MENSSLQVDNSKIKTSKLNRIIRNLKREKHIWLICIPIIIWVLIFAYYPMYGISIAFFKYIPGKSILSCEWKGLFYFKQIINTPNILLILRNTLALSGLGLLFGFPLPILLALLVNELRSKHFKKVVQTISYLPYFISTVVCASLVFSFLGSDGILNMALAKFGLIKDEISFLGEGKYIWGILTATNVWKGLGWSSIIYLAAIAGIDKQLYEAGEMDGLGRFGKIWHITLPGIRTTVILLLILSIGNILNAGFELNLLLGSPQTRDYWEVIDTYAYRYGLQMGRYSYAAAVTLIKSSIGLGLVLFANRLSKKVFDISVI